MPDEMCDVLPTGFLTGDLAPSTVQALARSGAIPAEYVRERAAHTLGAAFFAGAMFTAPVWYAVTWVLTHRI